MRSGLLASHRLFMVGSAFKTNPGPSCSIHDPIACHRLSPLLGQRSSSWATRCSASVLPIRMGVEHVVGADRFGHASGLLRRVHSRAPDRCSGSFIGLAAHQAFAALAAAMTTAVLMIHALQFDI